MYGRGNTEQRCLIFIIVSLKKMKDYRLAKNSLDRIQKEMYSKKGN